MNNQNRNLFEIEFNKILETEMSLTGKPGRDIAFERHPDYPDEYVQLRTVRAYRVWQAATKCSDQKWIDIEFIDSQLKEKGLLTLTQLLDQNPSPFLLHAGVNDFDTFTQWIELRYQETTKLKALLLAKNGVGVIDEDDLFGWSCAMANAYQEMYQQWKVVESNAKSKIESLQSEIQPFRVGKTGRKDITGDMINVGDEIWIIHSDADGENKLGVVQYMPNECCFMMVDGNNWEWFTDYTDDDSYGGLVKVENIGKYIQANR